jgi:hypothetical protein
MTEKAKTVKREELNYVLVEDTRPPIYTAMKYWGKKNTISGVNTLKIIRMKMAFI